MADATEAPIRYDGRHTSTGEMSRKPQMLFFNTLIFSPENWQKCRSIIRYRFLERT